MSFQQLCVSLSHSFFLLKEFIFTGGFLDKDSNFRELFLFQMQIQSVLSPEKGSMSHDISQTLFLFIVFFDLNFFFFFFELRVVYVWGRNGHQAIFTGRSRSTNKSESWIAKGTSWERFIQGQLVDSQLIYRQKGFFVSVGRLLIFRHNLVRD